MTTYYITNSYFTLDALEYLHTIVDNRTHMAEQRGLLVTEPRVGRNQQVFDMYKLSGLGTRLSVDELGQILNIAQGTMRFCGHRPLAPQDFEEFMDSIDPAQRVLYEDIVLPTYPGLVSSFALRSHAGEMLTHSDRVELDVIDVERGTVAIAHEAIRLSLPHLIPVRFRAPT